MKKTVLNRSILDIDKIKFYYPFLLDNRGIVRPIKEEVSDLLGYLLIADCIVIPPRSLFGGTYGTTNLNHIYNSNKLSFLFETGRIITTSSTNNVRDSRDLVEHYSGASEFLLPKFETYQRDIEIQKSSYSAHLSMHIANAQYYSEFIKKELLDFLSSQPEHPNVLQRIDSLKNELVPAEYERLKLEAFHGYFSGGSIGNGAIMPTMHPNDGKLTIYNPFYCKTAMMKFALKLQSITGKQLTATGNDKLAEIISNLKVFKIKYFELSKNYQDYYTKIIDLLGANRISLNLPTDALYVIIAVSIASALAGVLNEEVLWGSMLAAYSLKSLWAYLSKIMKITDFFAAKLQSYLSFTGVFQDFRKDIIALQDEFMASVESTLKGN